MWRHPMFGLLLLAALAQAEERTITVTTPMYFLPAPKAIVVVKANSPSPSDAKPQVLASVSKLPNTMTLNHDGPVDVWYMPKDGLPLRVVKGLKLTGTKSELKLQDYLGVLVIKGDEQPRGQLLVTPYDDEGPESKKHTVIQKASDVRAEMAVLPGDYAVWVVPASGARARRIVDKIRVLPGKTATVD